MRGTRESEGASRSAASRAELEQQLGSEFGEVISSDDFKVYNGYPVKAQQKCLAHLLRHFKKVVKLGYGNNPDLGQAFLDLIQEAFSQHRCLAANSGHYS